MHQGTLMGVRLSLHCWTGDHADLVILHIFRSNHTITITLNHFYPLSIISWFNNNFFGLL